MALSKDWREFFELLNSSGVDYVIVGAQRLARASTHYRLGTGWMLQTDVLSAILFAVASCTRSMPRGFRVSLRTTAASARTVRRPHGL